MKPEEANPTMNSLRKLRVTLLILATFAAIASSALAQSQEPERRKIPVSINKGENYTITGVR
jgi:hypothetical protein